VSARSLGWCRGRGAPYRVEVEVEDADGESFLSRAIGSIGGLLGSSGETGRLSWDREVERARKRIPEWFRLEVDWGGEGDYRVTVRVEDPAIGRTATTSRVVSIDSRRRGGLVRDAEAFDFDGDYGEIYDDIARTVIPGYEQLFQATLALLRLRIGREARVLVVGCGTGREMEAFARSEPGWLLTGVDPSPRMIEVSRKVVARLQIEDRVHLVQGEVGDVEQEPSFDAATVLNVMHFLPDDGSKQELMQSVADRVRPGAPVALFDLHGDRDSTAFRALEPGWVEFMSIRGLQGDALQSFLDRLRKGIAYVPESRVLEICEQADLQLVCKYFGGFLYGGWLLARGTAGAEP
jgi:tRNA (cmo5U34)-methyltransferase